MILRCLCEPSHNLTVATIYSKGGIFDMTILFVLTPDCVVWVRKIQPRPMSVNRVEQSISNHGPKMGDPLLPCPVPKQGEVHCWSIFCQQPMHCPHFMFEVLQAIKEEVYRFLYKTQPLAGYDCYGLLQLAAALNSVVAPFSRLRWK